MRLMRLIQFGTQNIINPFEMLLLAYALTISGFKLKS
jgi:hypothetical protein